MQVLHLFCFISPESQRYGFKFLLHRFVGQKHFNNFRPHQGNKEVVVDTQKQTSNSIMYIGMLVSKMIFLSFQTRFACELFPIFF